VFTLRHDTPSPGWNSKHSRVQILIVAQLLDGKQIDYPNMTGKTSKKAPKVDPAKKTNPPPGF